MKERFCRRIEQYEQNILLINGTVQNLGLL